MSRYFLIMCLLMVGPGPVSAAEIDLSPVRKWIEGQSTLKSLYGTFIQERNLRTLRRPLKSEGQFWYVAPGNVRWQLGKDPGQSIAVKNEKEVILIRPKKKESERYPVAELATHKKLSGFRFLEAGFPRSVEEFQKVFRVSDIKKVENHHVVVARMRDRKAAMAVLRMEFYLKEGSCELAAFRMFFRDESTIYNRFTELKPNVKIAPAIFSPDLSAYPPAK